MFHLDEAFAIWMLIEYGSRIFQGIKNARIRFVADEPNQPDPQALYIGIGDGRLGEFDEHRPDGRLQNCCASLLVAQRLGLVNRDNFISFLDEVLWCDTHQKVNPSHLASLIKTMHSVKDGTDQFGVYLWTKTAIEAALFGTYDQAYDIRVAWKNYREDHDIPLVKELEDFINQAHGRRNMSVGELAGVCARMRSDKRQKWLPKIFKTLCYNYDMFQAALDEIIDSGRFIEVETDNGRSERMLFITSDNKLVAKAATSTNAGKMSIVAVRSLSGRTAIMCNVARKIDLFGLAAMIRMAEYEASTGNKLPYESASGLGTVDAVQNWHLANENLLLNGSFTHPEVMPSALSLDKIVEIANQAFKKVCREAWFLRYRDSLATVSIQRQPEDLQLVV